jgi:hypothetical protein
MPHSNLALVVISCDDYLDVASVCQESIEAYLGFLPKKYLVANHQQQNIHGFNTLCIGDDQGYSASIKESLALIEEDNILLWIDDCALFREVDKHIFDEIYQIFIQERFSYLKLTSDYPLYYGNEIAGEIPKNIRYATSIGMSFYTKEYLLNLVEFGDSAWDLDKSTAARTLQGRIGSVSRGAIISPLFRYRNILIKGRISPWGNLLLKKRGKTLNRNNIGLLDTLYILFYQMFHHILAIFKFYY